MPDSEQETAGAKEREACFHRFAFLSRGVEEFVRVVGCLRV
jgi:hypothetical protein